MSTIIMSACWPLQMPMTAKAVLMSLADNANDHGECWPSQPYIAMRTCMSDRSVRNAIKWLEGAGYLVVDRSNGRHTRYTVCPTPEPRSTPERDSTPEPRSAQPRKDVPVPRNHVPEPRKDVPPNHQEPSLTVRSNRNKNTRARSGSADLLPDVPENVAADYIAIRKAKKAPLTSTAVDGLRREAERAGMSLADVLRLCCERGWIGFKADWVNGEQDRRSNVIHPPARNFREVSL